MKKKIIHHLAVVLILISSIVPIGATLTNQTQSQNPEKSVLSTAIVAESVTDFDPLCDIQVTFTVEKIRSLEKKFYKTNTEKVIDKGSKPDFYLIVTINDEKFASPVWRNAQYLYDVNWSVTTDVPDDQEFVTFRIQLFDWELGLDKPCDISSVHDNRLFFNYDVMLDYSIASGHWYGDDLISEGFWYSDPSGYGRVNGCDDRSYYDTERDAELWFDISQTDPDGDGAPYWAEVNVIGTDPLVNNAGWDNDTDGCPFQWEYKWGHQMWFDDEENITYHWWFYDPLGPDNHSQLDPDMDGLDNVEEYLTSHWGSDPFRDDLFIELDEMEQDSESRMVLFPDDSIELLNTVFDARNIVFYLDDGCMGGGETIPFSDAVLNRDNLTQYYYQYFLHENYSNWRLGVFHYALNLYDAGWAGYVFDNGHTRILDSFQISSKYHEEYTRENPVYNYLRRHTLRIQTQREYVYGAAFMHELGHTLNIFRGNTPGCDNGNTVQPFNLEYWKYGRYHSVMNYRYIYSALMDYSDGSRGKNDFDDWSNLDLTFFQIKQE